MYNKCFQFQPEMEFFDISLTKDESFVLCYSQSLILAVFKEPILFSGFKNPYKKNPQNKKP
jgi:hypothetical protein